MGLTLKSGPKWEDDSFNHINQAVLKLKSSTVRRDIVIRNPYLARRGGARGK